MGDTVSPGWPFLIVLSVVLASIGFMLALLICVLVLAAPSIGNATAAA